jgi:hypothetical protein
LYDFCVQLTEALVIMQLALEVAPIAPRCFAIGQHRDHIYHAEEPSTVLPLTTDHAPCAAIIEGQHRLIVAIVAIAASIHLGYLVRQRRSIVGFDDLTPGNGVFLTFDTAGEFGGGISRLTGLVAWSPSTDWRAITPEINHDTQARPYRAGS